MALRCFLGELNRTEAPGLRDSSGSPPPDTAKASPRSRGSGHQSPRSGRRQGLPGAARPPQRVSAVRRRGQEPPSLRYLGPEGSIPTPHSLAPPASPKVKELSEDLLYPLGKLTSQPRQPESGSMRPASLSRASGTPISLESLGSGQVYLKRPQGAQWASGSTRRGCWSAPLGGGASHKSRGQLGEHAPC